MKNLINYIHIVLGIFLMYVGIEGDHTPKSVFLLLAYVAGASLVYHLYKYFTTQSVVNLFHLVAVLPLLLFVGYYQSAAPPFAFTLVLFMGMAALWYHVLQILK